MSSRIGPVPPPVVPPTASVDADTEVRALETVLEAAVTSKDSFQSSQPTDGQPPAGDLPPQSLFQPAFSSLLPRSWQWRDLPVQNGQFVLPHFQRDGSPAAFQAPQAGRYALVTDPVTGSLHLVKPQRAAPHLAELVESKALLPVKVDGWREIAYIVPDARPRRPRREGATLLPPFDPIRRGNRARLARVFGFDHTIEVYVPAPRRRYGYYVFPVLFGDKLVGRVDLKADRTQGALRVLGGWIEPGLAPSEVAPALGQELASLREWLGLDDVAITRNGNLARGLSTV